MKWLAWLGCACVALATAGACSSDDGKKVQQAEDGGAAGEGASPAVAGSLSVGGEGGNGAAPVVEGGAAGAAPVSQGGQAGSAEGGAGGQPALEISLATLQGAWTGHIHSSYVCESNAQAIELTVEGSTLTRGGVTGEVEQQAGQAFTFALSQTADPLQTYVGQLFLHRSGKYALYVELGFYQGERAGEIALAILQKAPSTPPETTEEDVLGDWQGTGLELGEGFAVVEQFPSRGIFRATEGVVVDGEDRDGAFSGLVQQEVYEEPEPAFLSWEALQGSNPIGILTLMSDDKQVLAVALLRELDENDGALCDLTDPYADMSVHKFALWTKVDE